MTRTSDKGMDRNVERQGEVTLPVVEEELQVGKREVEAGGVRVTSRVAEQPVEETVSLREERISVERRPVDRPVDPRDDAAFREDSFELRQRAEEVVVSKEARVVEEVLVSKHVKEHTETIRDTLKRTDVEVERLGAEARAGGYDRYDADFRQHAATASSGGGYEEHAPAYRHGYDLATDEAFRDHDWSAIEGDARARWDGRSPGTWDRFKGSVRFAWERVRAALS